MTKQELIDFEKDISDIYCEGKIKAPVHLSDGNEDQLIEIFKMIKPDDWVFSTWRSHFHALLHGIPKERLKEKILRGDSITICDSEYRFLSSAIVGGILPIAMGAAMGEKKNGTDRQVFCFVGDMAAQCGIFHEVIKYAENFDLPLTIIIEDNSESVGTPTYKVWGMKEPEVTNSAPRKIGAKLWKYDYRKKFPHVGAGKWVQF